MSPHRRRLAACFVLHSCTPYSGWRGVKVALDFRFGHGMIPEALYKRIYAACDAWHAFRRALPPARPASRVRQGCDCDRCTVGSLHARRCHICAWTGLGAATSAPGLGSPPPSTSAPGLGCCPGGGTCRSQRSRTCTTSHRRHAATCSRTLFGHASRSPATRELRTEHPSRARSIRSLKAHSLMFRSESPPIPHSKPRGRPQCTHCL